METCAEAAGAYFLVIFYIKITQELIPNESRSILNSKIDGRENIFDNFIPELLLLYIFVFELVSFRYYHLGSRFRIWESTRSPHTLGLLIP